MQKEQDTTNILIFGDSNTWGFDCRTGGRFLHPQRWTTILQRALGENFNVIPEGLNGRTCIQEAECLFEEGEYDFNGRKHLKSIIHSHKPLDIIIVALGTNDTKVRFQNSATEIMFSVKTLVRDIQKMANIGRFEVENNRPSNLRPPKIIVMSLPTIHFVSPYSELYGLPPSVESLAKEVNRLLEIECRFLGVTFINTEEIGISSMDGLHFDLEHMQPLANLVEGAIRQIL